MVSVIIPTCGGGSGIEQTIDSILAQTYTNIEIIVVDDNGFGTQNQAATAKVLQPYLDTKQIKYITPQCNGGGSAARNIGAKASSGEYLMFLDDDDTVSEDKIEKQVEALQNTEKDYAIAYCSTKVFFDGKLSNIIYAKKSGDILNDYLRSNVYMGTGSVLLTHEAWESVGGYDESFSRHQDWEFFARLLNQYKAIAVPDVYFNRIILNRFLPKKLDIAEKNMDHYIQLLQTYPFRLPKGVIRRVVNVNNSRIALKYIRHGDCKNFFRVMKKYDKPHYAYFVLLRFTLGVLKDKMLGKKS